MEIIAQQWQQEGLQAHPPSKQKLEATSETDENHLQILCRSSAVFFYCLSAWVCFEMKMMMMLKMIAQFG